MLKRFQRSLCLVVIAVVCAAASLFAAVGTAVVTKSNIGGNVTKYSIAWTSNASGAVSANTFTVRSGRFVAVKFVPGASGVQPTNLYDITLVDTDSVDVLGGLGANLSNSAASMLSFDPPLLVDGTQAFDLVVANAGNAKSGTVILWVQ